MTQIFPANLLSFRSDNPKSKTCPELCRRIENLKWVGLLAIGVTLAMCGAVAQAQQPEKVAKIGWLGVGSASGQAPGTEVFR
jgi:hypothetical protein